jgi:uncharacterized protein
MTDEERQLIQGLTDRIRNAPAPQLDRDADNLIRQNIGQRPDALYILTQTVLIQEMALTQAKQQIEQLKAQTPQQPPASFLPGNTGGGRSFGGQQPPEPQSGRYQSSTYHSGYQAPQPPPLPQYIEVQQPAGGRFSGFLQNAAQTAAGVVAGEVAFSALSSLFGHHGGGGFFEGGGGYSPGSETIINNYYEDGPRGEGGGLGRDRDLDSSGLSPDLEDRRFAGDDSGNDDSSTDDDSTDDSADDNSSYDDSGDGGSGDDNSGGDGF